jgi:iron complex outermembrane receptor protein
MKKGTLLRMALLVGACLPTAAMAQTAAPQDETQSAGSDDIIVTATKRAQTLLDVPLSVAALSGDQLSNMAITQFNDLQSSVPNLQIDASNGNFIVSMRGLGSGGGNLAFEQSVGFFNDGVYSGRSRSMQTAMMDVERVEVVRGPQGALFGKNTNAGAISVITRAPTRTFEGELHGRYEFENQGYGGGGYLSGPLTDSLSARLSFQAGHEGGYLYNRVTKKDDFANNSFGVRGQLLFEPVGGGGSMLLKVEYAENNFDGSQITYNGLGTCAYCNDIRAASAAYGGPPEVPSFERAQSSAQDQFTRTNNLNLTLTSKLDLGGGWEMSSISAFQKLHANTQSDIDVSPLPLIFTRHWETTSQLSQELRFAGSVGPVDLIFGGSYFYAKSRIAQIIYWNAAGTSLGPVIGARFQGTSYLPFYQTSESWSPFVAADWHLTDELTFSGSLRYNHENKAARVGGVMTILAYPNYLYVRSRSESLWDYSGKLSYRFGPTAQVYLSYATGSKGGGYVSNSSALGLTGRVEFEPERARSWEIGAKFRLFDNRLAVNMAAFNTNFTDLQVSSYTGTSFTTGNAARARSRGIEGDASLRLSSMLTIGGSGAYLDARYRDYPGAACVYNAPTGCVSMNLAGYRLTRAPEWKWNAYAQLTVPVSDSWQLSGRVSADYTSESIYQDDRNPHNIMPGYTKLDARIAMSSDDLGLDVALIGRNLTNEVSFSQSFAIPLVAGTWGVFVNPGRTIALEVSKRF